MENIDKLVEEKRQDAVDYFDSGMNCTQAVLTALCDVVEFPKDMAVKTAAGFGGGMRHGEVCGAVSGAIMAIGYRFCNGDTADAQNKSAVSEKVIAFVERFKEKNGVTICKELIGYDVSTKDGAAAAKHDSDVPVKCREFIRNAVDIAIRIIAES